VLAQYGDLPEVCKWSQWAWPESRFRGPFSADADGASLGLFALLFRN